VFESTLITSWNDTLHSVICCRHLLRRRLRLRLVVDDVGHKPVCSYRMDLDVRDDFPDMRILREVMQPLLHHLEHFHEDRKGVQSGGAHLEYTKGVFVWGLIEVMVDPLFEGRQRLAHIPFHPDYILVHLLCKRTTGETHHGVSILVEPSHQSCDEVQEICRKTDVDISA